MTPERATGPLMLNRLRPGPVEEVAAAAAYAYPSGDGPYLRANMVSSVDGAAALEGTVGALTGPADQRLLLTLRSLCDVLIVGAATVRAEGYGPVKVLPELQAARREAGQLVAPRLAVLSRAIDVDLGSRAFTHAIERPIILTTELADAEQVRAAEEVAEVLVVGEESVDLRSAVDALAGMGLTRMLTEGGPSVLGALYAEHLVDELCLAVSPLVVGGDFTRVTSGPPLASPQPVELAAVLEKDDFLFLRYIRR
jgi:riboflavin biosynthesis pyrimidine reductase